MLRRAWKPLAATTFLIGTPSYLYYSFKYKQQTFDLAVRTKGPDGKPLMSHRTFALLSMDTVDARLKENATHESKSRPGGIIWNHSTASYAANDPIEDAHSSQIIERDGTDAAAPGDILFFTVMDGHSGFHTSRLLSKVLINAVALELSSLINDPRKATNNQSILQSLTSILRSPFKANTAYDSDPKYVSLAIQAAFSKLDFELLNTPLKLLAANLDDVAIKNNIIPDLSKHPMALTSMLPAVSGILRMHIPRET
jgi:pyruvate dehydrogenase phosphatase